MISVPNFYPQFLSPILSLFVPCAVIGDKLETNNVNDSDKGLSEKLPYMHGFHAILHDNVHKKLTAFPSMLCC